MGFYWVPIRALYPASFSLSVRVRCYASPRPTRQAFLPESPERLFLFQLLLALPLTLLGSNEDISRL
jgi:hypothetical protein